MGVRSTFLRRHQGESLSFQTEKKILINLMDNKNTEFEWNGKHTKQRPIGVV